MQRSLYPPHSSVCKLGQRMVELVFRLGSLIKPMKLYFAHLDHNGAYIVFTSTCQCCLHECMGCL